MLDSNNDMKKLLVLSGNNKKNIVWGEECSKFFENDFDKVFYLHYDHWKNGEESINIEVELQKIKKLVDETGEKGDWCIFAKSIGSVLALMAVKQKIFLPEKCVFFGMPLAIAESVVTDDWSYLSEFSVTTLAFHNDQDSTADYKFTKNKLAEMAPGITLVTLSDDTHNYLDFSEYADEIRKFISL